MAVQVVGTPAPSPSGDAGGCGPPTSVPGEDLTWSWSGWEQRRTHSGGADIESRPRREIGSSGGRRRWAESGDEVVLLSQGPVRPTGGSTSVVPSRVLYRSRPEPTDRSRPPSRRRRSETTEGRCRVQRSEFQGSGWKVTGRDCGRETGGPDPSPWSPRIEESWVGWGRTSYTPLIPDLSPHYGAGSNVTLVHSLSPEAGGRFREQGYVVGCSRDPHLHGTFGEGRV